MFGKTSDCRIDFDKLKLVGHSLKCVGLLDTHITGQIA
jgi:hypothetical protein